MRGLFFLTCCRAFHLPCTCHSTCHSTCHALVIPFVMHLSCRFRALTMLCSSHSSACQRVVASHPQPFHRQVTAQQAVRSMSESSGKRKADDKDKESEKPLKIPKAVTDATKILSEKGLAVTGENLKKCLDKKDYDRLGAIFRQNLSPEQKTPTRCLRMMILVETIWHNLLWVRLSSK